MFPFTLELIVPGPEKTQQVPLLPPSAFDVFNVTFRVPTAHPEFVIRAKVTFEVP